MIKRIWARLNLMLKVGLVSMLLSNGFIMSWNVFLDRCDAVPKCIIYATDLTAVAWIIISTVLFSVGVGLQIYRSMS
jgi:hypothetical protein